MLAFHFQQTYQIVYTVRGVPNGTGSFLTWLYSGLLGTSPWQGSCDWEVADIARERSPWRSRTLPSCRPLASTWCTYEVNPGELGRCPPKGVVLARKTPMAPADFRSWLTLGSLCEQAVPPCKKWVSWQFWKKSCQDCKFGHPRTQNSDVWAQNQERLEKRITGWGNEFLGITLKRIFSPWGPGSAACRWRRVSTPEHLGSTQTISVINIMKTDKLYLLELCALSNWHLQGTMKSLERKIAHVVHEKNYTVA